MKQIEITTRVKQTMDEVNNILTNQGFTLIRKSRVEDKYMSLDYNNLIKDNILDVLSRCAVIRYLCVNSVETYKKITYKNKIYKDNMVVSEEKINVDINDIGKAVELFNAIGFKNIVNVNYDVIVYKKDDLEFAFQEVEGLGLLLEYENLNDFSDLSDDEIIKEKEKMLQEVRKYKLDVSNEYDVKKAYELIFKCS